ncbi:MAG: hypothetical protein U0637_15825 [Phycisphaerales bacterium]
MITLGAVSSDMQTAVAFLAVLAPMALLIWGLYWFTNRERIAAMKDERLHRQRSFEAHIKHEEEQARQQAEFHTVVAAKHKLETQLLELQLEIAKAELEQRRAEATVGGVPSSQLNKLHAEKMRRESDLLEVQLELARRDLALRGDHLDYHDAMMEKSKLEIESLRLRIREQKKDLDGFGA